MKKKQSINKAKTTISDEVKKLEALKYNLTRLIVHDLRSPISSIMSSIDLLEQKKENLNAHDIDGFIEKIKKSCQSQLALIGDILEISRMENENLNLEKRKIHIPSLIEECLLQVESIIKQKEICLTVDVQKNLPSVFANERYLHRIITNLLNNSLKYTDRGGSIFVSVSYDKEKGESVFLVKDTGLGIPQEYIHKIFDQFFQVNESMKRSRRGVGLGLSFCRMAVKAHGGRIWVESKQNQGSSFYFTIPSYKL